jgi:hypothetical protein
MNEVRSLLAACKQHLTLLKSSLPLALMLLTVLLLLLLHSERNAVSAWMKSGVCFCCPANICVCARAVQAGFDTAHCARQQSRVLSQAFASELAKVCSLQGAKHKSSGRLSQHLVVHRLRYRVERTWLIIFG